MKQGWEIKKLGDVCISLEDGDWIEKKNQSNDGIRLIQTGNIGCGFYKDKSEKAKYISEDTFCALKCTEVIAGDILISRLPEPVGRACIIPHLGIKCITAVDCSIVKLNPNVILASWFIYYTQSSDYTAKVVSECSGTTRDRISRKKLSVITVPIPSLAEQKRIVEILDREFEKIDALKENAEKNLQHAKDLFQSALKQELQPKEGWATKTIRELSEELFAGGDVPKHAFSKTITSEYNVPIYANAVEQDGLYGYTNTARVNKASITIAGRGSGTGYIIERNEKYLPVVRLIVVVPQTQIVRNRFLYYALKSLDIKSNGSAIPQLTVPMIAQYKVNYPTLAAQDVIIGVLDKLSKNCRTLEENNTKTIALCNDMKQALLRKAFNGEL